MSYRKAKGMCFKCGSKWGPQHTCSESVPLHMVEELWQMVTDANMEKVTSEDCTSDSSEDLMSISAHAANGTYANKTVKLKGFLQQHKAAILIDSGSSHSFISEQLATLLPNWKELPKPINVRIANGGLLTCTHEITVCTWTVQGIQFQTSFKILPLKCYDAILGMDWLEKFSPMEVHWVKNGFHLIIKARELPFMAYSHLTISVYLSQGINCMPCKKRKLYGV